MDGGNLHVQAITYSRGAFVEKVIAGSARRQDFAEQIPQIVVAVEQYNRMVRMIQQCEKLKLEVELAVKFNEADATPYHTIAEIPGTDLKDQLVMLGAHLAGVPQPAQKWHRWGGWRVAWGRCGGRVLVAGGCWWRAGAGGGCLVLAGGWPVGGAWSRRFWWRILAHWNIFTGMR